MSCGNTTSSTHETSSIDQYATDLKIKSQTCEFAKLKDSLIYDRIVCGIVCDRTHVYLLKESDLTLQKALDICDRICEKVPFPHILHSSKQNDITFDSLY